MMTNENAELASLRTAIAASETVSGELVDRVVALVEQTHGFVAARANSALTLMNWHIGRLIDVEILKEDRADYA